MTLGRIDEEAVSEETASFFVAIRAGEELLPRLAAFCPFSG